MIRTEWEQMARWYRRLAEQADRNAVTYAPEQPAEAGRVQQQQQQQQQQTPPEKDENQ